MPETLSKDTLSVGNLDGLDADELEAVRDAAMQVSAYAATILTARRYRRAGLIEAALIEEAKANRLYDDLPDELKW